MNLATKTLIGVVLGIATGLLLSMYAPDVYTPLNNYVFDPAGSLFIKAIQMIVVPLVFTALVTSIASVGNMKTLGQMGSKTMAFFVGTTLIACTIGILLATIVGPGMNVNLSEDTVITQEVGHGDTESSPGTLPSLTDTVLNIVPSNAIGAMAEGNMLQVLTFSIIFGMAMVGLKDRVDSLRTFVTELNEVMMKIVQILMKVVPYAAFALVAESMGTAGLDLVGSMVKYLLVIVLGLTIHVAITFSSMLTLLAKRNPIEFFRKMIPAIGTAFATSSSAATLPVTKSCCEGGLNMSKSVSSFVLPLGMTVNMNGTSFSHGVAAVFVAQLSGIELGVVQYLTVILISLLASVGAPAIPGGGVVSLSMIFLAVGLPIDGIGFAILLGLFRVVDMFLTPVNVLGDAVCTSVVERRLHDTNQLTDRSVDVKG
ncbi:dicarboxylate/amino acid:cation symporter [Bacillus fonticola]|uniref:dicarboxylate/amino acid:cation symporter n=1 Tax=Bacillus fonticola TaxID=2728853 RepID=UPI00147610FA|nr:dicarboxylate/amino acid:cation symporter [Bacillus fonticola]